MTTDELEKQKLELEVSELQKSWLRKPDVLKVLLPTTFAIFSLIYAISTGFFSSKSELLELKKKQLEFEVSQFEKDKTNLIETNEKLEIKRLALLDTLKTKSFKLEKYRTSLNRERRKIREMNEELANLKNTRNNYNKQIAELQKDYEKKKEKYLTEIETQYYQEVEFEKKVQKLNDTILKLTDHIDNLEYNVRILQSNPFIKKKMEFDFKSWETKKMIKYLELKLSKHTKETDRLLEEYEKSEKSLDSLKVKQKVMEIKYNR